MLLGVFYSMYSPYFQNIFMIQNFTFYIFNL